MQSNLPTYVYDLEVYPNFFLAMFKEVSDNRNKTPVVFTWETRDTLAEFTNRKDLTLAGYNNYRFDDSLLKGVLSGVLASERAVFDVATALIERDDENPVVRMLARLKPNWTSIDLMQILGGPGKAGSLKSHEVRLGMMNVQDIPIEPGTELDDSQKRLITSYCANDVDATEALYFDCLQRIEVRHHVNVRYPYLKGSAFRQSDASIAESVMAGELARATGFDKRLYRPKSSFAFHPGDRIDPGIKFSTPANQCTLDRLRAFAAFDPKEWSQRHSIGFTFDVGEHKITLTQGGLHTDIGPTIVRSPQIIEFDVSSYYPNLLLKFNRVPEGLPRQWIEILRALTNERLDAKASGNKTMADVYKIVINSVYGKLADPYSINLDLSLQLQVVLNGQLFLLMLMERFHDRGFRVIAANTDGLYIDASGRREEAIPVARDWEDATGFQLGRKLATIYAATSVNHYALFHPDHGWFHKKGEFGIANRTKPAVIHQAVLQHISSGEPIESCIRRETDLLAFLYSASVKGDVAVKQNGLALQRTNRWYKSVSGSPIFRTSTNDRGQEKSAKVPNSDHAVVVNLLPNRLVPPDLDYSHYVASAETTICQLNTVIAKQPVISNRVKSARRAQRLGLVIVPKGLHKSAKANVPDTFVQETIDLWRRTPAAEADWGTYEGYGCYTGPDFGIVAIDIDNPGVAVASGIFELFGKNGLVTWHGSGNATDVRTGKKRGSIIFQYNGNELGSTNARFLKDYGFEILYGKHVVQLGGFHHNGEPYKWVGKPTPLPSDLLQRLSWLIPEAVAAADDEQDEPGSTARLAQFCELANIDEQYAGDGGELKFATDKENRVHLKGICVGNAFHSDGSRERTMKVSVWQGALKVSCFHKSCDDARRAWGDRIIEKMIVRKPVRLNHEDLIVQREFQGVWDALQSGSKNKLIVAPTGAGKTHNVVTHVAALLAYGDATTNEGATAPDKFAIICSSKDQMRQIGERFAAVFGSDNINDHGIDLIEADEAITIGKAQSRKEVSTGTRVAITHYTYVSRRQFGLEYYAFLKFIDSQTHVFIDEVDAFVASQTTNISLGSRFKRVGSTGISNNVRLHKCGMHDKFNNCRNCVMRKYDGFKVSVDQYGVPIYSPRFEFTDQDQNQQLEHIEIDNLELSRVRIGTTEVRMLRQADDPGPIQYWDSKPLTEDGERKKTPSFPELFADHLQSAYLPTVHRPIILLDDQEVDRQEIIARYAEGSGHKLVIPAEDRSRLKFPNRPCNVLTLALIDRRPLALMAKAKSVTMLSATVGSMHERFLSDTLGGIDKSVIAAADERRMDQIIVVGMTKSIPVKHLVEGKWKCGKMLRFRETQSAAEREFDKFKGSNLTTIFGFSSRKFMGNTDDLKKEADILLTYSLGSLGRGMDLPLYDIVCVNAAIYKPISAYVTNQPDRVRELIYEDRSNTLLQNLGRVLRRPPGESRVTKVVVLEDIESAEEFDYICGRLSSMSIEPVKSWWVPEFLAAETICERLTEICETKSLPADLPKGPDDLVANAAKLVAEGFGKKEIKQKLRWSVTRRCLAGGELKEVEARIDHLLETRDPAIRRAKVKSPEKIVKMRERRAIKIRKLIEEGKTDGQIRSNMKVNDARQGWHEDEAEWFERLLIDERAARQRAA